MPDSDIQIFTRSVLKVDIATLEYNINIAAEEALNQICDLIVSYAKFYAPVETGSLRDSIRRESGGEQWLTKRVRAGGYIINPKTGRFVDYAGYVESKTPFMQPAVDQIQPEINLIVEGKLQDSLKVMV